MTYVCNPLLVSSQEKKKLGLNGIGWILPMIHNIHYNDAKRRVYGKNLAKKQKRSVPCSVLFSSRYIDEIKIFRQSFVSGSG